MIAIPSPVCSGPLKTCTGVIFEGNTDEYPNGRRNQTLDGQAALVLNYFEDLSVD
jgi:hypothetical protein